MFNGTKVLLKNEIELNISNVIKFKSKKLYILIVNGQFKIPHARLSFLQNFKCIRNRANSN